MAWHIKTRSDTAANWTSANPVLLVGEIGLETDTKKYKVGDGTTAWGSLTYWSGVAWGGITGTLANQSDLSSALSGKAPTSHQHSPTDVTGTAVINSDSRLSDARTPTVHTHAESDVTNLVTDIAGKAAASHSHAPGDVTGTAVVTNDSRLSDARTPTAHNHAPSDVTGTAVVTADSRLSDARTPTAHGHAESDVTNLTSDLAGKAATSHSHAESDVTNLTSDLAGKAASSHSHAESDVTNLTTDLGAKEATANKGAASGYCGLDSSSKVAIGNIPTGSSSSTVCIGNDSRLSDARSPDVSYFRKAGTGTYEAWYSSPRSGTALSGSSLTINKLYAMPFITPKAITLDRMGVYVSTLGTSAHGRMGIYSDSGQYPSSLVIDAGAIDASTTGAKTLTISQALNANSLYWLVYVCDVAHAIYCIPVAGVINVLGTSSALGTAQNAGLYASQTYGSLPSTFPGSPTMITAAPIPCVFVRLSA